jgi:hypothetical protein
MPALMIRKDLPPGELRWLAKAERGRQVARRLLAIAAAARIAGMDRQTLRDWVIATTGAGQPGCWMIGAMDGPAG